MTDRRYSIIPARAVTDPHLEGRDLQVLGFLGTHTDKLGWCFLRQGEIAKAIDCGRSTVQRSLARLIDAGWVQTKEFTGTRPHACHAYRVIMDRDDPQLEPPADVAGDDDDGSRYPPVGTSPGGASPAGTGAQPRTGTSEPEVPTHAWAHKDQDSSCCSSDPRARAKACEISLEAFTVADEIAKVAGHDPAFLPTRWVSDGPALRVQMMFDRGWRGEMMIETARAIMQQKRDGPPLSIRYFEKPFAQAHARQSQPAPLPQAASDQRSVEVTHETARHAGDWKARRDRGHSALDRFGQALDDAEDNQCGQAGSPVVQTDVPT